MEKEILHYENAIKNKFDSTQKSIDAFNKLLEKILHNANFKNWFKFDNQRGIRFCEWIQHKMNHVCNNFLYQENFLMLLNILINHIHDQNKIEDLINNVFELLKLDYDNQLFSQIDSQLRELNQIENKTMSTKERNQKIDSIIYSIKAQTISNKDKYSVNKISKIKEDFNKRLTHFSNLCEGKHMAQYKQINKVENNISHLKIQIHEYEENKRKNNELQKTLKEKIDEQNIQILEFQDKPDSDHLQARILSLEKQIEEQQKQFNKIQETLNEQIEEQNQNKQIIQDQEKIISNLRQEIQNLEFQFKHCIEEQETFEK